MVLNRKVTSPQIELEEAGQNMEEMHESVVSAKVGVEVGRRAMEATGSGGIVVNDQHWESSILSC